MEQSKTKSEQDRQCRAVRLKFRPGVGINQQGSRLEIEHRRASAGHLKVSLLIPRRTEGRANDRGSILGSAEIAELGVLDGVAPIRPWTPPSLCADDGLGLLADLA